MLIIVQTTSCLSPCQAEARLDDNELALAPAPSRLHDTVGKPRVDSTYVSQVSSLNESHSPLSVSTLFYLSVLLNFQYKVHFTPYHTLATVTFSTVLFLFFFSLQRMAGEPRQGNPSNVPLPEGVTATSLQQQQQAQQQALLASHQAPLNNVGGTDYKPPSGGNK